MRQIREFFRKRLWGFDLRDEPWPVRLGIGSLRVLSHVVTSYEKHLVGPRAGGLTVVTLLSIVPLVAIAFGVADAFEFREMLDDVIARNTADLPEYLQKAVSHVQQLVERTSFKGLGLVGTLVLVWSAMTLFFRVEQSLNYAWRAHASRSIVRRTTTFLSLLLVVPAFMLGAVTISSALSSAPLIERMRESMPSLMTLYDAGLWVLPHVMASIAFFALYRLLPNARVDWRAAAVAAVLAGFGLVSMHMAYVHFQIGVARNNAIYATLAALPLLLIYLQLVWTVVLLGAEVGYAIQNVHRLGAEQGPDTMSWATREQIAAGLVARMLRRFDRGEGPLELADCAAGFDVPREWIDVVTEDLVASGIAVRVEDGALLPARPAARISVGDVLRAVRGRVPEELRERLSLPREIEQSITDSRRDSAASDVRFVTPLESAPGGA